MTSRTPALWSSVSSRSTRADPSLPHLSAERAVGGVNFGAYGLVMSAPGRYGTRAAPDGRRGVGGGDPGGGTGVLGLWDRVAVFDGSMAVFSERRRGTVVSAEPPLAAGTWPCRRPRPRWLPARGRTDGHDGIRCGERPSEAEARPVRGHHECSAPAQAPADRAGRRRTPLPGRPRRAAGEPGPSGHRSGRRRGRAARGSGPYGPRPCGDRHQDAADETPGRVAGGRGHPQVPPRHRAPPAVPRASRSRTLPS